MFVALVHFLHLCIMRLVSICYCVYRVLMICWWAPKVHEELHGQRKWMKEWRQVGRHLQAMEGERGDRIS